MGLVELIYAYLLGGVTFIPLLVISFIYLQPKYQDNEASDEANEENNPVGLKAGEIEEEQNSGIKAYKSGWLTVTQEYIESTDDITPTTQSINESHDSKSAYSTLYKLVKNSDPKVDNDLKAADISNNSSTTSANNNKPSEPIRSSHKKHRFYAILKHGNLFLYKNESLKDVKHVIVLSNQFITLWPRDVLDSQLFTKRTTICIMKKDWSRTRRLSEKFEHEKLTVDDVLDPLNNLEPPKSSFFIHCGTNIEKEDWYFALIRGTKIDDDLGHLSSSIYAKTLHFETKHMIDLIQTIYSSEGQLQTKWFNALLGRLFLALQKTEVLNDFLKSRISKKLNKIKTPGFLEKFKLGKLYPGDSAPYFTYPNLKEISPDGNLVFTAYVHYHGKLSCHISTKVLINLGGRIKAREVDVVLAVTLQKLEGPMVFKMKPPPSERIWYAFEIEPIMNLKIEPIISSRQMTYNIITSSIEKKFKEAIKESLVVPHFDDLVFYNTEDEKFRGGVWDKSSREEYESPTPFDSNTESLLDPNINEPTAASSINHSSDLSETQSMASLQSSNKGIDAAASLSSSQTTPTMNNKLKLSNTINDIQQKMKKTKSSHTVSVNGDNWLSDGSIIEAKSEDSPEKFPSVSSNANGIGKTLKKIGDWYSLREEKPDPTNYQRPEMILNRRIPRKSSADQTKVLGNYSSPVASSPSYEMFTKGDRDSFSLFDGHSRKNSRLSVSSNDSPIVAHRRKESFVQDGPSMSPSLPFGQEPGIFLERESFPSENTLFRSENEVEDNSNSSVDAVEPRNDHTIIENETPLTKEEGTNGNSSKDNLRVDTNSIDTKGLDQKDNRSSRLSFSNPLAELVVEKSVDDSLLKANAVTDTSSEVARESSPSLSTESPMKPLHRKSPPPL